MNGNNPVSRNNGIIVQELKDETIIYNLQNNKTLCLNQTSSIVWQNCNGKNSVSEISRILSNNLKKIVSEDVVFLALRQLADENLLEQNFEYSNTISNISRRELVKKAGLTTMAALPIVVSLVAPKAIHSQSVKLADGSACTSTAQCQNACCELQPGGGGICGLDNGRTCL